MPSGVKRILLQKLKVRLPERFKAAEENFTLRRVLRDHGAVTQAFVLTAEWRKRSQHTCAGSSSIIGVVVERSGFIFSLLFQQQFEFSKVLFNHFSIFLEVRF